MTGNLKFDQMTRRAAFGVVAKQDATVAALRKHCGVGVVGALALQRSLVEAGLMTPAARGRGRGRVTAEQAAKEQQFEVLVESTDALYRLLGEEAPQGKIPELVSLATTTRPAAPKVDAKAPKLPGMEKFGTAKGAVA
jgi:hypothetical protein